MEQRIFCTTALVIGLLTAYLPISDSLPLTSGFIIVSLWFKVFRKRSAVGFVALSFLIGLGRGAYDSHQPVLNLPNRIEVEGSIVDSPRKWGKASVFLLSVEKLSGERPENPLKILVRWSGCEENLEPGDRWAFEGRPSHGEEPAYPGAFDQGNWLWCQGAEAVLPLHKRSYVRYLGPPEEFHPASLAQQARQWMVRRLKVVQAERERGLVVGVVFGETTSLPKELQDQFRRTGTSHLLAASGMNVALLAGLILACGRKLGFGPWRVAPFAIPPVIFYAFLAGCAPSITRASLATTLALLALIIGRRSDPWNSICLSTWGLLIWDPRQIFDMGFQLSVVAVIGLVLSPSSPKKLKWLWQPILLTVSATLATFPILWCSFGELSTTTLPANLVLGPLVETLFPLGLLLSLVPFVPLAWPVTGIAWLSLKLVALFSGLSDPLYLTPPAWWGWTLWLLACALWFGSPHRGDRFCAALLMGLAMAQTIWFGWQPQALAGTLILRQVSGDRPLYWLSVGRRELLILSESWQKERGLAMLRKQGCLSQPEIFYLKKGRDLDFRWRDFQWSEVKPLLTASPYLEVRVTGSHYRTHNWWPNTPRRGQK